MIPRRLIGGYFGDAAATTGKKLCYDPSPNDPLQEVWAGTTATQIVWNGVTQPVPAGQAGLVVPAGTSSCSGTPYVDYLKFNHQGIRNRDKLLLFQGPFAMKDLGQQKWTTQSFSSGVMTVNWEYLPGVSSAITGVTVYKRNNTSPWSDDGIRGMMDGYNCGAITTMSNMGDVPVAQKTFAVSGVTQAEYDSSNVQVLLCPYTDTGNGRKYWESGMIVDLQNYGGGGGPQLATKLAASGPFKNVTTISSQATVYGDTCYPLKIEALTANDMRGQLPPPGMLTLSITTADGSADLYSSSDCVSGAANLISNPSWWGNDEMVWVKPSGGSLTVNVSAGSLTPTAFYMTTTASQVADTLKWYGSSTLKQYECTRASVGLTKAGIPAALGATVMVDFDVAGGWEFYTTGDCSGGPMSDYTLLASQTFQDFSFVYAGTLVGTRTVGIYTGDPNFSGGTVQATNVTVSAAPTPGKLIFYDLPPTIEAGKCYEFGVRLASSGGQETPHIASYMQTPGDMWIDFTVPAGSGQYFSSSCGSGGSGFTSKYIRPYRAWTDKAKFRATSTGVVTVGGSITNSLAGGLSVNPYVTQTVNVVAGQPSRLVVLVPGESLFTNGPSGTPGGQASGVPFTAVVYAVNDDWHVADGTDGMVNYSGTVNFTDANANTSYSSNMLNFSGGSATVSITYTTSGTFRPSMVNATPGGLPIEQGTPSLISAP